MNGLTDRERASIVWIGLAAALGVFWQPMRRFVIGVLGAMLTPVFGAISHSEITARERPGAIVGCHVAGVGEDAIQEFWLLSLRASAERAIG